jgi:Tfp pilus assembly protein PilP
VVHRWMKGWRRRATARGCVAGLALGADGLHWVVLCGGGAAPEQVLAAQSRAMPLTGERGGAEPLAHALRVLLQDAPSPVTALYLALPDAQVERHVQALPAQLQPEDVQFQLQAEMAARFPDLGPQACLAYRCLSPQEGGQEAGPTLLHEVVAAPRGVVQTWQQLADRVGVRLGGIGVCEDLLALCPEPSQVGATEGVALTRQQHAAYASARMAWHAGAFNLCPDRRRIGRGAWRRWMHPLVGCAVLGVALGVVLGGWFGLPQVLALSTEPPSGPPIVAQLTQSDAPLPDDDSRVLRTPVQDVPLTRLRYVGTLAREGVLQALVQVVDDPTTAVPADASMPVHRVAEGDGIGADAGRVQRIASEALHIRQWRPAPGGGWLNEVVLLPLLQAGSGQ